MATLIRAMLGKAAGGLRSVTVTVVPSRTIAGKELRQSRPSYPKPAPFNYKEKDYGPYTAIFDRTTHRIDENSKVIVVEGPIGVGKTELAKHLACEFDMCHFDEANLDMLYLRPNGIDMRIFDDQVPVDCQTFDHRNFCVNPTHRNVAAFQLLTYRQRYMQYIDALTHLLNTGQGVVLERSPYSDFIFLETMYKHKYISKEARSIYYELRNMTIQELMRPHLVIYLDIPVPVVKDRIAQRKLPHEQNSPALTDSYLQNIEYLYKYKYLQEISTHAELLVYDWTNKGDLDVVVEDIERIDFEQPRQRDEPKLKDWRLEREVDWMEQRQLYTNHRDKLLNDFNIPRFDAPELLISGEDNLAFDNVVENHPVCRYLPGYGANDTGLLFKNKQPKYFEEY